MINIVKHKTAASLYLAHSIWGVVCIALFAVLVVSWLVLDSAWQELTNLKHQYAETAQASDCTSRDAWQPGTTRTFTTELQAEHRAYRVHLPVTFVNTKRYPVVLALAGKGEHAKGFQLTRGLDTLPAIIVYPEPTLGIDGTTAWQGAPYSSRADDVTFISSVLDKVEGQLCIQKPHIYTVGWSNGGGLAWLLSCRLGDRIAAFAMIAGAFYYPEHDCQAKQPTSILTIHGDLDPMVPYYGSSPRHLPSIETWIATRAKNNGCKPLPVTTYPDVFTQVETWQQCDNATTVQNVRLLGGGHAWPTMLHTNASGTALGTPEVLWNFFTRYPVDR